MLWTLLLGSVVVVVWLRWSSDGITWQDGLAVSIAVCAVFGYALYAWSKGADLPIPSDQAGDNAYYIGLVLTFASLGVALVKLVVVDDSGSPGAVVAGEAKRVARLIPDFGVALASTVAGIIARLALQQQRQSPAEASEQARRDLDVAVRDFARKLRIATGEISSATNAVRLGVAKQLEDAVQSQVETFDESGAKVRDAADSMAARLRGLSERFGNALAETVKHLEVIDAANLGSSVRGLSDGADRARTQINDMGDASARVSMQIADVVGSLTSLAHRLENFAPEQTTARMKELAAQATEQMQHALENVEHAGEEARRTNEIADHTSARAAEARLRMDRMVQLVDETSEELATGKQAVGEKLTGLSAEVEEARRGLVAAQQWTNEVVDGTSAKATEVQRGMDRMAQLVDEAAEEVATGKQAVGEKLTGLSTDVEEVRRGLDAAQRWTNEVVDGTSARATEVQRGMDRMAQLVDETAEEVATGKQAVGEKLTGLGADVDEIRSGLSAAQRFADASSRATASLGSISESVDAVRSTEESVRRKAEAMANDMDSGERPGGVCREGVGAGGYTSQVCGAARGRSARFAARPWRGATESPGAQGHTKAEAARLLER